MKKITIRATRPEPTGPKFYEFRQNNSGGSLVKNHEAGISVRVIVEATSADEANRIAEGIGLYFDGAGDCSCCGNRWYETWETVDLDGYDGDYASESVEDGEPLAYIHYLDGKIEGLIK